jgi:hypothetical protein
MPALPDNINLATCTVIVTLAIGLGTLLVTAGFSFWTGALVGTVTGAIAWWAATCEPRCEQ